MKMCQRWLLWVLSWALLTISHQQKTLMSNTGVHLIATEPTYKKGEKSVLSCMCVVSNDGTQTSPGGGGGPGRPALHRRLIVREINADVHKHKSDPTRTQCVAFTSASHNIETCHHPIFVQSGG